MIYSEEIGTLRLDNHHNSQKLLSMSLKKPGLFLLI